MINFGFSLSRSNLIQKKNKFYVNFKMLSSNFERAAYSLFTFRSLVYLNRLAFGYVSLPARYNNFSVLKSPFVNKKARRQYVNPKFTSIYSYSGRTHNCSLIDSKLSFIKYLFVFAKGWAPKVSLGATKIRLRLISYFF